MTSPDRAMGARNGATKSRRIWAVIAVFHTTEAMGGAIRELAKGGLASRMTVIAGRDVLTSSRGAALGAGSGSELSVGPAGSRKAGRAAPVFQRRLVSLDNGYPGGPVMVSEGPLSRRLCVPSGEAMVSFAESIRALLPSCHAAGLVKRIGEGALVIWIDAPTDEDRQCASRILLRHSRLHVQIHDVLAVDAG